MFQYLIVWCITQCNGIQIILLHELIEEVGAEHDRFRNRNMCILILVQLRVALDDIIKKSQATPFTAKRPLTDTGKMAVRIKLHPIKYSHHSDVFHPTILHDSVEDYLTMGIDILKFMPRDVLQES